MLFEHLHQPQWTAQGLAPSFATGRLAQNAAVPGENAPLSRSIPASLGSLGGPELLNIHELLVRAQLTISQPGTESVPGTVYRPRATSNSLSLAGVWPSTGSQTSVYHQPSGEKAMFP